MITTYGPAEVARWCGVTRSAVSNWRERYGDWPVPPAVRILTPAGAHFGWLPEQKAGWLAWMAGEAASDAPGARP